MVVVRNLRMTGYIGLDTQLVAGYVVFGLNVMAAIAGFWTRFRVAWISYLFLTVVCMFLLSSSPLGSSMDNGQVGGSTHLRMRQHQSFPRGIHCGI